METLLTNALHQVEIEIDASTNRMRSIRQQEAVGAGKRGDSNVLEMMVVFFILKAFRKRVKGKTVLIQSDNISVVSHTMKMGGMHSQQF